MSIIKFSKIVLQKFELEIDVMSPPRFTWISKDNKIFIKDKWVTPVRLIR